MLGSTCSVQISLRALTFTFSRIQTHWLDNLGLGLFALVYCAQVKVYFEGHNSTWQWFVSYASVKAKIPFQQHRLTTIEVPTLLALRRDPRLLKAPPYLSALCILVGVVWLCLLPLNEYSRYTYISENALLPGQVHTYFGGSEQNVFNAFKHEIQELAGKEQSEYVLRILGRWMRFPEC